MKNFYKTPLVICLFLAVMFMIVETAAADVPDEPTIPTAETQEHNIGVVPGHVGDKFPERCVCLNRKGIYPPIN